MPNRPDWRPWTEVSPGPESGKRLADDDVVVDGRYRVLGVLGRGAMGVVYRAEDVWLGRPVALKVIEPSLSHDRAPVERFQKEAKTLAQVRHENVVQVYTFGQHHTAFYLAMEYVDGRGLDTIIDEHAVRGTFVSREQGLGIVRDVALGLAAVHARSIVHRDVKPSNVVIEDRTARPVLIDFGLARRRSPSQAKLSVTGGTPCYMPHEQATDADGTRTGPPSDVYALGCTAFELFTNRPVFVGASAFDLLTAHTREVPPNVSSIRPELRALDRVISRALAKSPHDRYPNAAAFLADLEAAAARMGSVFPPAETTAIRRRIRVLILENDEALRRQLVRTAERVLRAPGDAVEIECVAWAETFVAAFERTSADIVIIDDENAGRDGASLLKTMRTMPDGEHAEALLLSRKWVRSMEELAALRARELPKPISAQAFGAVLSRLGAALVQRNPKPTP